MSLQANEENNYQLTVEEYGNMEWKRIMTEKQAEMLDLAKAGRYEEINQKLLELGTSCVEYKDAHGNIVLNAIQTT